MFAQIFYSSVALLALQAIPLLGQGVNIPVGEDLAPEKVRNISTNKIHKIFVKGNNARMRMAIAAIANTMARDLNELLLEEDAYLGSRPLYIEMYEKGKSKGSLQVRPRVTSFDDSEIVIELLVDTRVKVDRAILEQGVLDILLYRRGLEGVKVLGVDQEAQVPAWVNYGLQEVLKLEKDNSRRRVYEHLLSYPKLFPLEKVLSSNRRAVRAFDTTNQSFYRAASCALVLSLLRQDDGEESMRNFLAEVVLFEGEMDILLRKHFPLLSIGANSIQKMWSLQVAEIAAPKLTDTFSIAETDLKLTKLLMLNVPDGEGNAQLVPLEEYTVLDEMKKSERIQATEALRRGVIHLSSRCHPSYRPLLLEYARLSVDLANGDIALVEERLPVMASERQNMVIADERCRDYLDWYQITRAYEVTGDFSGYMQLKERLAMESEERKDESIDVYLDKIQQLMQREKE